MDSNQKATGQDTFFCQSCSDSFESEGNGIRRNTGARLAKVTIRGRDTVDTVAAYLPGNYKVLGMQGDDIMIGGVDNHGWTLDDYVIPRLASGMMHCEEIILDLEHILKYDPLDLLNPRRRYLTTMSEDGCIEAWLNPFRPQTLVEAEGCIEWIWQWAESSDEAIAQHVAKHDEWTADIDAGRELKETY